MSTNKDDFGQLNGFNVYTAIYMFYALFCINSFNCITKQILSEKNNIILYMIDTALLSYSYTIYAYSNDSPVVFKTGNCQKNNTTCHFN